MLLTCEMTDEQSQTNTDRCNECSLVLFGSQHEYSEDKFCRQEHLNEQSLRDRCPTGEFCPDGQIAWKQTRHNGRSNDATEELDYYQ